MRWTVKSTDVKSAFLQGKPIKRDVYLQPPKEAINSKGTLWKLNRCLYGLNDAARQFYVSVSEVLMKHGCIQSSLDPALFLYRSEHELHGIVACHVDDFFHAGDEMFEHNVINPLRKHFSAGRCEDTSFTYIGFDILQDNMDIIVSQDAYVAQLEDPVLSSQRTSQKSDKLSSTESTLFRTLVGKLNWVVQGSRPDLAFDMVELSTKFKNATIRDLIRAIKGIRKVKSANSCIKFPVIGHIKEWKIVTFSDASHANLPDGVSSTSGHVVFLVGERNGCCAISWQTNKIKRIVRSTLAAESLSFQVALEDAMFHRKLLMEILNLQSSVFPIIAFTDSKSLTEAVKSTKMVDDKRLRIDIAAIKQSPKDEDVELRWCPGAMQLANCLTKRGAQSNLLLEVLQTGKLHMEGR